MEQAINLFTKGLQCDTHPMVQGNDTLTDCLNGTLITMNGDEVILQNDMGNRRVDNAFLPAGFEPIGIKEYGGIIYIAAYNPITNQSQIGCFPSPLRKYNNIGKELSISCSYGGANDLFKVSTESEINYLINDSYLKLLIDKPLIPGDKFLTTFDIWDSKITLDEDDPRKLYSTYYGILNSQNLFINISDSLMRWTIRLPNNESRHHFLALASTNAPSSGWDLDITIATQAFEENRLKYDMNTYSGKLVGYPYIKVQLNHPVNFTYSYTGFRIDDKIQLDIVGKLDYNCPDPSYNNNNNYKKKYGFSLKASVLYNSNNVDDSNIVTASDYIVPEDVNITQINKDTITNLYSKIIKKTYLFNSIQNNNGSTLTPTNLSGNLLIPVEINDPNEIYLKNLCVPISLDFSLFGSNRLILTSWGFKKDGDDIILRYNIDNYFSNIITYSDLKLTLKDITDPSNTLAPIPLNGIGGTIRISGLLGLINRHVYTANISYKIVDLDGLLDSELKYVENTFDNGDKLWILNTHLFDECYNFGDKYIKNYCNRTTEELKTFNQLTEINIYIDGSLTEEPIPNQSDIHIPSSGYVECSSLSNIISFTVSNTTSKRFNKSGLDIKTKNVDLYPDDINSKFHNRTYRLELTNTSIDVKDIGGKYYFGTIPDNINLYITSVISENNNKATITVTYPDFFYGQALSKTSINNVPFVFHKIDDEVIDTWSYSNQGALDFRISEYPILSTFPNKLVLFSEKIGNNNNVLIRLLNIDEPTDISGVGLYNVGSTRDNGTSLYWKEFLIDSNGVSKLIDDNVIKNPTKYFFMYREDDEDTIAVGGSFFGVNIVSERIYLLLHAQMDVLDRHGEVTKYNEYNETRNSGEKKCLIYAKCRKYDIHSLSSDFLNSPIDENAKVVWGIIPGMVNLQDSTLSRKNVIDKIKSLFDSESRMCVRAKETIHVYTIKKASENAYYSRIIDLDYKQNVNIQGSIDETNIEYTSGDDNKKLSFKINNTCNDIFKVTFTLNSYNDYVLKLNTDYPQINPYFDLDTGKYISNSQFNNLLTQHFVYVPNQNGGFTQVNNVLMLYCDKLKDCFGPIFYQNRDDGKYIKLVSHTAIDDCANEFIVDFTKLGEYRPYPIKQLTT